jgi:protein-glucosylgalactosylhydroxylysine glucosidase
MRRFRLQYLGSILWLLCLSVNLCAQQINRQALIERHKVVNTDFDSLSSLTVGNGTFAFTVDPTGLQSFPEHYVKGVPLGTESEWGWHSYPDTVGYQREETYRSYELNGRERAYCVQWNQPQRKKAASDWFRQNPHRLQLGIIGLVILKKDRTEALLRDLKQVRQILNP